MKVNLKNNNGKIKKVNINFSFLYFLFGPLYALFKGFYLRFFLLSLLYITFILNNFLNLIFNFINGIVSLPSFLEEISLIPLNDPIYSYIFIFIIHLVISLLTPRAIIKKALKKQDYHPLKEIDTQKLVKYNLVKIGRKSYNEIFYPKDGLIGKVKIEDEKAIKKELDNLAQLLKKGMITQDEYNQKRISLIMRTSEK